MSGIDVHRKTQAPLADRSGSALASGTHIVTTADGDATYVTATITGDPADPDVTLYLNGVAL